MVHWYFVLDFRHTYQAALAFSVSLPELPFLACPEDDPILLLLTELSWV